MAHAQKPVFAYRMIGIRDSQFQWVAKHGRGFCKIDAVLLNILLFFFGIPLEFHHDSNLMRLTLALSRARKLKRSVSCRASAPVPGSAPTRPRTRAAPAPITEAQCSGQVKTDSQLSTTALFS